MLEPAAARNHGSSSQLMQVLPRSAVADDSGLSVVTGACGGRATDVLEQPDVLLPLVCTNVPGTCQPSHSHAPVAGASTECVVVENGSRRAAEHQQGCSLPLGRLNGQQGSRGIVRQWGSSTIRCRSRSRDSSPAGRVSGRIESTISSGLVAKCSPMAPLVRRRLRLITTWLPEVGQKFDHASTCLTCAPCCRLVAMLRCSPPGTREHSSSHLHVCHCTLVCVCVQKCVLPDVREGGVE